MTELLFNNWWLPVVVIVLGVLLWLGGNKRTDSRVRFAGLGVALLGLLLFVASFLVETPNKRVTRLAGELVQTVKDQDWPKLQSLLDPNVSLSLLNGSIRYHSRDQLLEGAKEGTRRFGLHGASSHVDEVVRQGELLTTTLHVVVDADAGLGHPVPSDWQLDWEKDPAGNWTVRDIRCVKIGMSNGEDAAQYIPQAK